MLKISNGQCGLCSHFGEGTGHEQQLVQIRIKGEAPEDLVEPCGHPNNRNVDLRVTPVSGCAGFTPAQAA